MKQLTQLRRWTVAMAIVLSLVSGVGQIAWAQSIESKFTAAQQGVSELNKNAAQQKFRDRWLRCINDFLAVYQQDPKGPWAAAGLYNAGILYGELYQRSYLPQDKQEAIVLLDRVVRNYPTSRYKPKAQAARQQLSGTTAQKPSGGNDANPSDRPAMSDLPSKTKTAEIRPEANQWYQKGESHYQRLQRQPELQKFRHQWIACITRYRKAYQADPRGGLAAPSLLGLALSYNGMYKWSRTADDRQEAEKAIKELSTKFPDSTYAAKAKALLNHGGPVDGAQAEVDNIAQVIETTQSNPSTSSDAGTATSSQPAVVEGLRFWSNPRYTRIVIDASLNTIFTYRELREDPSIGKPQRIYVDLHHSRLGKKLQKVVPINDNLLSDARAGQFSDGTVRVVVDIKSAKTFKIFSLNNPFRIVLDVWGVAGDKAPKVMVKPEPVAINTGSGKLPPSAIVKQLALGVRRIVIDPGHGGKDWGAPGHTKGVHEKNVVLDIANRLARKMRSELNCEVVMTRTKDNYLSLEERTAIANTQNADLFVSIHTNASPDKRAYGIETFMLNLATDDESIRVAARENATSTKNISDLDSILKDLMQNAKVNESARLAGYVQQSMIRRLEGKYDNIRNKGVKQAPFYVLLGADMPSILVETSFISNARECRRLTSSGYQEHLCQGIMEGIKRYIEETNPTASWNPPARRGG